MDWLKAAIAFRGRASRLSFWRWNLIVSAVAVVFFLASTTITLTEAPGARILAGVALAPSLLLLIPTLAVAVRRLHDRNKAAWWLLLLYVLPFSLDAIAEPMLKDRDHPSLLAVVMALAAIGLMIWSWLELGVFRGTRGPNRFGPEPGRG